MSDDRRSSADIGRSRRVVEGAAPLTADPDPGPPTVPDQLENVSFTIERYSPWYGFVERTPTLRFTAWTMRYWRAGSRFRWRMVRTTLAFAGLALGVLALLSWA